MKILNKQTPLVPSLNALSSIESLEGIEDSYTMKRVS